MKTYNSLCCPLRCGDRFQRLRFWRMSGTFTSDLEGELNSVIKEYLEYFGFQNTAQAFEDECQKFGKPLQDNSKSLRKHDRIFKIQKELQSYFDDGKRMEFFLAWDSYFGDGSSITNSYLELLEFQLHVHFAVYPLKNLDKFDEITIEDEMQIFRSYLESKGSSLNHLPEILPYYALPYIPDPRKHSTFQELFQDSWSQAIKSKLETFVWETLQDSLFTSYQPQLLEIFNLNDMTIKDIRQELRSTEKKLEESEKRCLCHVKQIFQLKEDYQKLLVVAGDLISAMEAAVKGNLVDIDRLLGLISERFPEIFSSDSCGSGRLTRESKEQFTTQAQQMKNCLHRQSLEVAEPLLLGLNYRKVKRNLVSADQREKLFLLQAIRWTLTKPQNDEQREMQLAIYIANDLFGCEKPSHYQQQILETVASADDSLLQSITRLLNAFVSFHKGRVYLSQCPLLVKILMNYLVEDKGNYHVTVNMILGILQKLSPRRALQLLMVDGGMVEWLLSILQTPNKLDSYGLEYSIALLMNLSLRKIGREQSKLIAGKMLRVLMNLMKMNNTQIQPYVNGTLYSLLSDETIRKKARELGLEDAINVQKLKSSPLDCKKFDFVLTKLNSEMKENETEDDDDYEEDEDEEGIEIEPEVDEDDNLVPNEQEKSGEKLLIAEYMEGPSQTGTPPSRKSVLTCSSSVDVPIEMASSATSQESKTFDSADGARRTSVSSLSPPSDAQTPLPVTPKSSKKLDMNATELISKITGKPVKLVEAEEIASPPSEGVNGIEAQVFTVAFSSRPKIPRTPEPELSD